MDWRKWDDPVAVGSRSLAVVIEETLFHSIQSRSKLRATLAKLDAALSCGAPLILYLPNGLRHFWYRRWTRQVLAREGFRSVQLYLTDPSGGCLRDSLAFVPYSDGPAWAVSYLSNGSPGKLKIWALLKHRLKRALYAAFGAYNPRFALLILARKDPGQVSGLTLGFADRLKKAASAKERIGESSVVVATFSRRSRRHFLFCYDKCTSKLVAVAKLSSRGDDLGGLVRRSFDNLTLLSSVEEVLAKDRIAVPTLLDSEVSDAMTFYIQRAAPGECLEGLISDCFRRDDRRALASLVSSALRVQRVMQDALTDNLGSRAPAVDRRYFENYLNISVELDDLLSSDFNRSVQHGDFAPLNLFYDRREERWGIIDWEWMGIGYPPLFDVFSFLSAVGLLVGEQRGATSVGARVDSFTKVFFGANWLSLIAKDHILSHCNHYGVSRGRVYPLFLRFLLFQCGKYRLAVTGFPEFLSFYEELLNHSLTHKERFVFA